MLFPLIVLKTLNVYGKVQENTITYSIPTAKVAPHGENQRWQSWKIKGIVRTLKIPPIRNVSPKFKS